ncbi:helix-turn-helix transcriptional regulator [Rothia halotolerans]|uniref:helix-turn-helix transcriptional regulator n=1 Tax=Rothia halotolerans TaxID=405770 RepID=UPI00101CE152|nr:LuxR C-terminal-related transcriptional regulator [Rothia halotolerans]
MADLRRALWAGDADALLNVIESHPLESWHAIRPWHTRRLLEALPRHRAAASDVVHYVFGTGPHAGWCDAGPVGHAGSMGHAGSARRAVPTGRASPEVHPGGVVHAGQADRSEQEGCGEAGRHSVWAMVCELREQRRGRPRAAMEAGLSVREVLALRPEGVNPAVWKAMCCYEIGVTSMLAGEMSAALEAFAAVQSAEPPRRMGMYSRDALVKTALVHVLFGDDAVARAKLSTSAYAGRTKSWVEAQIDLDTRFTRAIADGEQRPGALLRLAGGAQIDALGKLWPFYVYALWRACRRQGALPAFRGRLDELEARIPAELRGDGFPGSALPIARACFELEDGRPDVADRHLDEADQQFFLTRLVRSRVALRSGRPEEALEAAASLRPDTRSLRRLELLRSSMGADAALQSGRPEEAAAFLGEGLRRTGGLREAEIGEFSTRVRRFAEASVDDWPRPGGAAHARPGLTPREMELLPALCGEGTRKEIAERLLISFNTLKTHQRMLYRKMGVSNREELRLVAEKSGLI